MVTENGGVPVKTPTYLAEVNTSSLLPNLLKSNRYFGEYKSSFHIEQGKLIYMRKFSMNKGEFPADTYAEFVEFYKNLNKAGNAKVVFVNKT
jgi:hypothetical protein